VDKVPCRLLCSKHSSMTCEAASLVQPPSLTPSGFFFFFEFLKDRRLTFGENQSSPGTVSGSRRRGSFFLYCLGSRRSAWDPSTGVISPVYKATQLGTYRMDVSLHYSCPSLCLSFAGAVVSVHNTPPNLQDATGTPVTRPC